MSFFIEGRISQEAISKFMQSQQDKSNCGAHLSFVGQVRSDNFAEKKVVGIDYSCYEEMAIKSLEEISKKAYENYTIESLLIRHSKGLVKANENSLFVLLSAAHRKHSFAALQWIVEEIKFTVPIWKKELFDDGSHRWKEDKR